MGSNGKVDQELDQVTPEVFFGHIVPAVLTATAKQRQAAKVSGSFELAIFDKGVKSWTVDLNEGRVHEGTHGKTDCYIEMSQKDFSDMIYDRLDVEGAIKVGCLCFIGKAPVFAHFVNIMRPSTVGY